MSQCSIPKMYPQEIAPIPATAGIGLRAEHCQEFLDIRPKVSWLEVHSENYYGAGGKPLDILTKIRCDYLLSFHSVGLSLGSADPLNLKHLEKLKQLIERFKPSLISDHLCWSSINNQYLNDLLPLPYTEEALQHITDRINQTQDYLQQQFLIENISSYLQFSHSTIPEAEFLNEVAIRTSCGILLDINNLYVNKINHGWDTDQYLQTLPAHLIKEIHLAGFTKKSFEDGFVLIDTHDQPVTEDVWDLYRQTLQRFGNIPTLIEWDANLPPLDILLDEAAKANCIMENLNVITA